MRSENLPLPELEALHWRQQMLPFAEGHADPLLADSGTLHMSCTHVHLKGKGVGKSRRGKWGRGEAGITFAAGASTISNGKAQSSNVISYHPIRHICPALVVCSYLVCVRLRSSHSLNLSKDWSCRQAPESHISRLRKHQNAGLQEEHCSNSHELLIDVLLVLFFRV